jgi:arabinofuranosyltransferase
MTDRHKYQLGLWSIAAATAISVFLGWRLFWFLTDDAFIAFRYASNSMLGRGYVWNPAPFVPVEGYTSFAWVVLLREVWALTGVMPPDAANWLSLAFGYATLWLGARMVLRMRLPPALERWRLLWLSLVLLATVSNRTFLTWLSSGLETSLFNFALTFWVYAATGPAGLARVTQLATSTALLCLTRPDGLLFAASTALLLLAESVCEPLTGRRVRRLLLCCLPLLAIPLHLWFRYATYGQWLPNTYVAKFVAPWPESGALYLKSFAFEYGVWFWALIGLAFIVRLFIDSPSDGDEMRALVAALPPALTAATLLAHAGYYTWVIGGDHFEYRVYSHAALLLSLSALWMSARLTRRPGMVGALMIGFILVSWPISWTHWYATHSVTTKTFRHRLRVEIAPLFPEALRPLAAAWDRTQAKLIVHAVGSRQIEHKIFAERMLAQAPPRSVGEKITWQAHPVIAWESVGVIGWSLPNVAVIDMHGLNDRVVARTPPPKGMFRKMAHERLPPAGYAECYRPNVEIHHREAFERRRKLTDAQIVACDSIERWVVAATAAK